MPAAVRQSLIALSLSFVAVAFYHRLRARVPGERLDRTREGWGILVSLRLIGLATFGSTGLWLWKPAMFEWAAFPVPEAARWIGVAWYAAAVAWLIWMFHSLGRNLTDTVVTRARARFVEHGPYRFVRNPMYVGILMVGWSLGLALGTWLQPLGASAVFALLAMRTRIEERYLIERFGEQYRDYMRRVGRFFPRRLTKPATAQGDPSRHP